MKKAALGAAAAVLLAATFVVVPSVLRLRVAGGETAWLADIRTVISAEQAYASANGGFYDTLACLNAPSRCLPGHAANAPTFLDPVLSSLAVKSGYKRTFHPGPAAPPADIARLKASPSSIVGYAYVAEPASPDARTRSFCGEATGYVCWTAGPMAPAAGGVCPKDCTVLQ